MLNLLEFLNNNSDTIGHGLRHANSALDLASKIKTLARGSKPPSNSELEPLVTALISEIQEAKLTNIELKEQLIEMKEAALANQALESKLDRYELWETHAGETVYRLKAGCTEGQHLHYVCPVCFENAKISILQGAGAVKSCRVCDKPARHYRFEPEKPRPSRPNRFRSRV